MDRRGQGDPNAFEPLDGQSCRFKTKHPLPPIFSDNFTKALSMKLALDLSDEIKPFLGPDDFERDNGI